MKSTKTNVENLLKTMIRAFPAVAIVHKAEDGGYWVDSPQLGGCFTTGSTVAEALHNFKFAIFEYFDIPKKYQKPESFEMHSIEIPEPKSAKRSEAITFVPTREFVAVF